MVFDFIFYCVATHTLYTKANALRLASAKNIGRYTQANTGHLVVIIVGINLNSSAITFS